MGKGVIGSNVAAERFSSFSDAVIAIVITILVLDIHVPERMPQGAIPQFLLELEHDILLYAASFWLVGIYWQLHHILSSYLSYVNQRLVNLNLLFLFALTLLPFLAKLKNTYPEDPVAAQIFGLGHLACGLSMLHMWRYVCSHPDLRSREVPVEVVRLLSRGIAVCCALAVAATSSAHINARLCVYLLPTVPIAYALMLARFTRLRGH